MRKRQRRVQVWLTDEEKMAGHWPDEFISRSGKFVKYAILGLEFCGI